MGNRILYIPRKKTGKITITKLVKEWVNNSIGGALYNWYAVADTREIAPDGWHVPTRTEIAALKTYLGTGGGGKLKETGTIYWQTQSAGVTNEYGFSGRGAGSRDGNDGAFAGIKRWGSSWSTIGTETAAYFLALNYDSDEIDVDGTTQKGDANSIRLLKDDSTDPGTMTDQDGNTYDTVKIGDQVWMKQNLMTTHFNGGVEGSVAYGYLYNRYVIANIAGNDWHVPSKAEWDTLGNVVGFPDGGGHLKETEYTYWNTPNTGATNEYGFNARGTGKRVYNTGAFSDIKGATYYWTTNNDVININYNSAALYAGNLDYKNGFSLRLVCDSTTDPGKYTGNDGKEYTTVKIGNQVWMSQDLMETKYNDGSPIPIITDNTDWTNDTSGARCSYNNDESNAGVTAQTSEIPGASSTFSNSAWAALTSAGMCWYNDDSSNGYSTDLETVTDETEFEITISGVLGEVRSGNVSQGVPLVFNGLPFDTYSIEETPVTGATPTYDPETVTLNLQNQNGAFEVLNTVDETFVPTVYDVVIEAIADTTVAENSAYESVTPSLSSTPYGTVTWGLTGADASKFTINETTGVVSMVARDYESPADANANNVYEVGVTATDGLGHTDSETWTVTVTNVIEGNVNDGYLYNWYAINTGKMASSGWHVPSKAEFDTLGASYNDNTMGGKLKTTGTTYWNSPNTGATNEYGFNAKGTGYRGISGGEFKEYKKVTSYWSTTTVGNAAHDATLSFDNDDLTYGHLNWLEHGLSVRLIYGSSTDPGRYVGNDGKEYPTIKIGNQVWLAANLKETKYNDGSSIPEVTDPTTWVGLSTGARCSYNNDENNA